MNHESLLKAIDQAKDRSYGTDENSELGRRRAEAIEAYLGFNTNPAPEGRSQVVDRSVFETIHTILPSLTRIFAGSSEEVCKFLPVGPEDEAAAEQTTAVVNHIATQLNPWEQIVTDWVHDALLLPNSYCLAWWDESERRTRETYEGKSDDELTALTQDKGVTIVQHSEYVDEQMTADARELWRQQVAQAQQMGQDPSLIPAPQPVVLHDVVIERVEPDGKVCLRVLPPEHCYISADTPDWTLKDCPYFEYREEKSIADLRAMGLDVPDDVSDDDQAEDAEEDSARNRFNESDFFGDEQQGALRRVWTRMIWIQADGDDSGIVQTWYVLAVGRTILHAEPVSRVFVASMTAQPMPHRHPGMSVAETVLDIQNIKTAVKRGGLDNLYLANNARWAVSSRVNLDDMLNVRPGGVVRMLDESLPSEGHILPMATPLAFDSIIGSLEYFDQERQNRSGASRYFSGTDANAINKTASGTIALQNMAAMRVEHIARMMAPAVEYLFDLVHELVSKHRIKPLVIKLRGQWASVDPQAWRTKRDCRISVGVGAGNKESMQMHLAQMFGAQMQLLPLGVAGPQHVHATVVEMAKLAGFANPAKFWQDPSQMPPQEPQIPPEVQKEQMRIQAEAQKEQFRAQQEQMKAQADAQLERERMEMQARLDQHREEMQARQKLLEAEQKAALEAQKAQIQAQSEAARLAFDKWRAELDAAVQLQIASLRQPKLEPDARVDELIDAVQRMMAELEAPAEIVRGPDGRAVGVKRGDRVRQIVRGPDGRAIGVQ